MNKYVVAGLLLFCLITSYAGKAQVKTISYTISPEDFANPERGFYVPLGNKPGTLSAAELVKYRNLPADQKLHATANYTARASLVYRGYLLSDFKTSPLSSDFLAKLTHDFQAVRQAGLKIILRFAYTNDAKSGNCSDANKICPPYGDASKPIILQHIAQLKPILTQNADVIAVLQEGFIGIWGENYYTDYFGVPAENPGGILSDNNWRDRNEVLQALLTALPADRIVQVRTPQIKRKYVYGPQAVISGATITEPEAFNNTDKARIGLHNDCFLASSDDYGTFEFFGYKAPAPESANEILRRYFETESRFVPVGGETCDDAFSPDNDCAPAGHAEQEMAAMHYSYLNSSYNNQVNNDWVTGGCFDNIKRNLGYRLVLKSADLPLKVKKGKNLAVSLELENVGYAAPFNPRPVQLILRNKKSGEVHTLAFNTEIRQWYPGQIKLNSSFSIPVNLSKGEYELLLNLPDKYQSIAGRPEYSIRLANQDTWEPETGYNQLHHTIKIN